MEFKGKPLSLGSKLFAVFFVLLCFFLLAFGVFDKNSITVWDILAVGIFLALAFSPVDLSLMLQNWPVMRGFPLSPQDRNPPNGKRESEPRETRPPPGGKGRASKEEPPCGP